MRSEERTRHVVAPEREFLIDNLLVRIHFIIVTIKWTSLAPWEFEFPFPGSLELFPRFQTFSVVKTEVQPFLRPGFSLFK